MFNLLPKNPTFFNELEALSGHVHSVSAQLQDLVETFPKLDKHIEQIEKERREATQQMEASLLNLDNAFITPLDREDIMNLITDLYSVVDTVADLSQRFVLYKLERLYPNLNRQSDTLDKVSIQLDEIIRALRHNAKLKELRPKIEEIHRLQDTAAHNRQLFYGELFANSLDPADIIKKKDLHDTMEKAINACEHASRTLQRVLLKNS